MTSMEDATSETTTNAEQDDELIDEARELISLSGVRQGQILRAGVELGIFDVVDQTVTPASDIAHDWRWIPTTPTAYCVRCARSAW